MRSLDFPATPGPRFFRAVSRPYAGNDPDAEDFDGDGLSTRDEILIFGTDPLVRDSDGNGVADGGGDSDLDGLPDSVEIRAGLDAHDSADAGGDLDRDGITNLAEYQAGTDPANPDTDHDGLGDAWESLHGDPVVFSDSAADTDLDGLTSLTECLLGTSPDLADTDGNGISDADEDADLDGVSNLQEQAAGTSPTDYYGGKSVSVTLVSGDYQAISPGETTAPVTVKVARAGAAGAALANAPVFVAPTCAGTAGGAPQPGAVFRTGQDGTCSFTFEAAADALIGTSPLFIGLGSLPTGESWVRVNLEIIPPAPPEETTSAAARAGALEQAAVAVSSAESGAARAVFPAVVKLADLPVPANTVPWKINDRGQVAYLNYSQNGLLIWNSGSLVTVPQAYPGFLYVRDLNSAGKLVGELQRVELIDSNFRRTTWAFHADIGAARLSILQPDVPDLYQSWESLSSGAWTPTRRFDALNQSTFSHIAESGTAWGVRDGFQNVSTASTLGNRRNYQTEMLAGIPAAYQTSSGAWTALPGNSENFSKFQNDTVAIGPVGAISVPSAISPDASHWLLSTGSSSVTVGNMLGSTSYSTRSVTRLEARPDIGLPAQLPGAVAGITDAGDIAGSGEYSTYDPYFLRNGTLVRFGAVDQVLGLANRELSEPAMVLGKKGVWLQRTDPATGLPQPLAKGANAFEYRTYQDLGASLALANLEALAVSKQGNTVVLAGTNAQGLASTVTASLIPVEVVELSPKTKDENGVDIAGSEKPSIGTPLTPFVEVDSVTNKIAHRELKVRIGEALKGKTVTWTMEPGFIPNYSPTGPNLPPVFRGNWTTAAASHRNRFEASTAYGANEFTSLSQASGRTTVADDGFTAIRVNVPPVGYNVAKIKIQIEGTASPIDLIDMEVPAIVVVDPGHGGTADVSGSHWNNATSPSGVMEKTMALDYGLALRTSLKNKAKENKLNLRVLMTRETDENVAGANRAAKARDNGADLIFIIHFNASDAHTARGTLEVVRSAGNVNSAEDTQLANTVIDLMVPAIQQYDSAANKRFSVVNDTSVASDANLGNTAAYHPIRAAYCEVEFVDFGANTATLTDDAVDILLNTGPNASPVRQATANAMRDGILLDLKAQP